MKLRVKAKGRVNRRKRLNPCFPMYSRRRKRIPHRPIASHRAKKRIAPSAIRKWIGSRWRRPGGAPSATTREVFNKQLTGSGCSASGSGRAKRETRRTNFEPIYKELFKRVEYHFVLPNL